MKLPIFQIKINEGRRTADQEAVHGLVDSISKVGLLNPITVDQDYTLIAGLHRLEAAKLLGWRSIECAVRTLDGLLAELAEIDENLIRRKLHYTDEGKQLIRRKEIYEELHPETQQGKRNGQTSKTDTVSVLETKPFAEDAAEKLGTTARTVRRKIQVAQKLAPEVQQLAKDENIRFRDALKLSRLPPEQQEAAASQLTAGDIHSMDEYHPAPAEPEEPPPVPESSPEPPVPPSVPYSLGDKHYASVEESIADLKNPDKDCSYTPDTLLADIDGFVDTFHRNFAWYHDPFCTVVFPRISQVQFDFVRQRFETIFSAMEDLLSLMERNINK